MKSFALLGALAGAALAQSTAPAWGQCGGEGWTGPTTCVSGYVCTASNQWYSQCIPGTAAPTTTRATLTTSTRTSSVPNPTGFRHFGVDESVAEFAYDIYPGTWGVHFRFPEPSAIQTLISEGMNTFRVAFRMERMAVGSLTDNFDAAYLRNLTETVNFITSRGAYAVIDPHNYGRYKGAIITDTNAFASFWTKLATAFRSNPRVIWDTNNEYNTMPQQLVFDLNQAAINAIRRAGATTQPIWVEGNSWTGAWTWVEINDNLKGLTDPNNNLVYQMHQYLDSDGSGTHPECVSTTIGAERIRAATGWLRQNGKQGVIGEYAGGPNPTCRTAISGMLEYMRQNSDVWQGALWWAAGPWWGDYMYSYEPPSGSAYTYYNSIMRQYAAR
ncbi:endo-1,4-beta-glucanase precursor [Stachybotrys elegans]|uniref:cellulase n=1 Tax=Stachybotrys elegans TaxID=80388 RepID=A0A8K0SUA9_9HYPO|nr:endo-1,4-beta-glucanase precursor [Stachybotrys elegans]